jgi:small subunit ribosomal protein S14
MLCSCPLLRTVEGCVLFGSRGFTMNIRILRDIKARNGVKVTEIVRRAYLYVARNQALPPQVRHQAQLQLNTFSRYTRPTTVKNRCTESGRGRGIISEFGLCRVRFLDDPSFPLS